MKVGVLETGVPDKHSVCVRQSLQKPQTAHGAYFHESASAKPVSSHRIAPTVVHLIRSFDTDRESGVRASRAVSLVSQSSGVDVTLFTLRIVNKMRSDQLAIKNQIDSIRIEMVAMVHLTSRAETRTVNRNAQ